jgi:hypothetical protein
MVLAVRRITCRVLSSKAGGNQVAQRPLARRSVQTQTKYAAANSVIGRRLPEDFDCQNFLDELGRWMIFEAIHNFICEPRSKIGRDRHLSPATAAGVSNADGN